MREVNLISEVRHPVKAEDLTVYIYHLKERSVEDRYNENYKLLKQLKRLNNNSIIVYEKNLVFSFVKISNWSIDCVINEQEYFTPMQEEYRVIDTANAMERKGLERLIKQELIVNADSSRYKTEDYNNPFCLRVPDYDQDGTQIFENIFVCVDVKETGTILIGFDFNYTFEFDHTIEKDIVDHNLSYGARLYDIYNNKRYTFVRQLPQTIEEHLDGLGSSIIEYYARIGESWKLNTTSTATHVVEVQDGDGNALYYSPTVLKKMCTFGLLSYEAKQITRNTATSKINFILDNAIEILKNGEHMALNESDTKFYMICEQLGYTCGTFNDPIMLFGKESEGEDVYKTVRYMGVYGRDKEDKEGEARRTIKIKYFIDNYFLHSKNKIAEIDKLCRELETYSKSIGITIERERMGKEEFDINMGIDMTDRRSIKEGLKKIAANTSSPSVCIISENNIRAFYEGAKNVFSANNSIAIQCINYEKLLKIGTASPYKKDTTFMNILLGIYAKVGVKAWRLKKELHSDLFIGLDGSRENGRNVATALQIIAKDGTTLSASLVTGLQEGDKLNTEKLTSILKEAIGVYKDKYGQKVKHITIHRDSTFKVDTDALDKMAKELKVKYDYVMISGNVNRRIASTDIDQEPVIIGGKKAQQWYTVEGRYYLRTQDSALICTSSPINAVGMARPIEVRSVTHNRPFIELLEDVYNLTFMCVHSINKARTPATVFYASLCQLNAGKEYLPCQMQDKLYFV